MPSSSSSSSNNKGPSLKARLARAFLNFLDEHGDYRSELEEAAARAAAAEANSLFAKDRRNKKKKKRRGKLGDGEEEEYDDEDVYDEIGAPQDVSPLSEDTTSTSSKHPQLPDDPYEQIQFYFATFKHRTSLQIQDRLTNYQNLTTSWLDSELHHASHIPLLSGSMLLITLTLYLIKLGTKKMTVEILLDCTTYGQ